MSNAIIALFAFVTPIVLVGCSSSDEKANKLYIEGCLIAEQSRDATDASYTEAYHYYKLAKEKIELIMSRHASSQLAVRLMNGEIRIGTLTLKEFRGIEDLLRTRADAEANPVSCALLVAMMI